MSVSILIGTKLLEALEMESDNGVFSWAAGAGGGCC